MDIKLFESKRIRSQWSDLKKKLHAEGSEVYEEIVQLKMKAEDGKMRETDVADTQSLLRLIQLNEAAKVMVQFVLSSLFAYLYANKKDRNVMDK